MKPDYLEYVNIKQGTASEERYSNGNTLPLVAVPFGMNHFSMQTKAAGDGWFYHPAHKQLEGIRLTHQPSPWVRDYGHFVMMPQNGEVYIHEEERSTGFIERELNPACLELYLKRYHAVTKLTATERGAVMKISWEKMERPRFAVLPFLFHTKLCLDEKTGELGGETYACGDGTRSDFKIYFYMKFDRPIDIENTVITQPSGKKTRGLSGEGKGTGINIAFRMQRTEELTVKLAASFLSLEQAKYNLEQETGERSYEEMKAEAVTKWNDLLSKIEIRDTEEVCRTFYSCLYRCFLFPRIFYERDREGRTLHYSTRDGTVKPGVMYTDQGFWDTYRTLYPLLVLLMPSRVQEMLRGYLNFYEEEGWLPKWLSPGERGMMPGTLIEAVFADAAVKGLLSEAERETAMRGMLKDANEASPAPQNGRIGVADYVEKGYIPSNRYKESVNNALDAYYCDFCISQMAETLDKRELAQQYRRRAAGYRLLFDEEAGFIRGMDEYGNREPDFSPIRWGGEYCEGAAWQNAFSVFHDIEGLADLYGGKEKLSEKLDELFAAPPDYEVGTYQKEIHEMTEMSSADFGQCAISNQPGFHIPYLYAALGYQDKTVLWVRKIAREAFDASEQGYPGDEDNGSMSAWYVFSSLGFYPLCPGKKEYILGDCLVKEALLHLENGRTVELRSIGTDYEECTGIQVEVDHNIIEKTVITHEQLMNASVICFYHITEDERKAQAYEKSNC